MINWKVRIKNKQFWLAVVPALALVVQAVAALFGYSIDLTSVVGKIQALINAVFGLLVILGIVVDPTTAGVGDSKRALEYDVPWEDEPDIMQEADDGMDPEPENQPCPPMPKGEEKE